MEEIEILKNRIQQLETTVAKLQQAFVSSSAYAGEFEEEEHDCEDDEPMTKEEMEDWYEEQKEREEEEEMERAASCKCGALQIMNYKVIQVADCICGA